MSEDVETLAISLDTGDTLETLDAITARLERVAALVDQIHGAGLALNGATLAEPLGPNDALVIMPAEPGPPWTSERCAIIAETMGRKLGRETVVFPDRVDMLAIHRSIDSEAPAMDGEE